MGKKLDGQNLDRQKPKEDRSNRKSTAVSVAKDLARKIGVISQHRGISQSDLVSPVIREFIEAQYALVSAEIQQEVKDRKAARA